MVANPPFTFLAAFLVVHLSTEACPVPRDVGEFRKSFTFEGVFGYLEADFRREVGDFRHGDGLSSQLDSSVVVQFLSTTMTFLVWTLCFYLIRGQESAKKSSGKHY